MDILKEEGKFQEVFGNKVNTSSEEEEIELINKLVSLSKEISIEKLELVSFIRIHSERTQHLKSIDECGCPIAVKYRKILKSKS